MNLIALNFPDSPSAGPWLLFFVMTTIATLAICLPIGVFLHRTTKKKEATVLPAGFASFEVVRWSLHRSRNILGLLACAVGVLSIVGAFAASIAGLPNILFFYTAVSAIPLIGVFILLSLPVRRVLCKKCGNSLVAFHETPSGSEVARTHYFCEHCKCRVDESF